VAGLVLGGVSQPAGVYNATTSPLYISGNGSLQVVPPSNTPTVFTGISVSGTTLTLTATNGTAGGQYLLLESTNLLLPINQWTPVLTNTFNGSGDVSLSTNIIQPGNAQEFYLLQP
jgi:hypothetical protein